VLEVKNLLEIDRFQIMGPGDVPTHLTFDTIYRKKPGRPSIIVPSSLQPAGFNGDPTGIFDWAGEIWEATAKGSFTASYDDGTFWVKGTMDSTVTSPKLPWQGHAKGHMGHQRNGVFAHRSGREDRR
jgi:hypothetical protein